MIFSDSAAALASVSRCQNACTCEVLGMAPESDLAQRLWPHLQNSVRSFRKIKAHSDPHQTLDLLECYHQLGNLVADAAAVDTARNLFPSFVSDVTDHHDFLTEQRNMLRKLHCMHLEMSQCRAQLSSILDTENQQQTMTLAAPKGDFLQEACCWTFLRQLGCTGFFSQQHSVWSVGVDTFTGCDGMVASDQLAF